jgi:hypothetical protein
MKIIHSMSLVAALTVASMVGCSSSTPSPLPGGNPSSSSGGSPNATTSSGSGGSASGTAETSGSAATTGTSTGSPAPGSGATASSGSSAGSSDDASAGSGSAGDAESVLPTRGCGQGTSCTPGTDLAPPAAADGFQIVTPASAFPIGPNEEAYYCYYKTIPSSTAIQVGAFQSVMTKGFSHHFILFTGADGADGSVSGGLVSNGGTGCVPQGSWVYATSTSGEIIELKMPDGVGLPMPASQMLIFNIHVINVGTTAAKPQVKLNVLFAKNATQAAGAMVSFNAGIAVPPNGGKQDVTGTCSPPAGSKFFAYTTHVHRHGGSTATGAYTDVNFLSGGKSTNIVHTTDWENPDVGLWNPPDFLTVKTGDQFQYHCHFVNEDATEVTFGETAASGEMCMSIGYYFPAGAATMGTTNPYCH